MFKSRVLTATILVLMLIGAAGRVFRPLKAINVPKNTTTVAPATANKDLPAGTVTIGTQKFQVEIVSTDAEKAQGLSDRASLASGTGMLFTFSPPSRPYFWMKDMRFALDFVWIADGKVVGVNRNVPPPKPGTAAMDLPTYLAPQPIDYVLEVNAGAASQINSGDAVTISNAKSI